MGQSQKDHGASMQPGQFARLEKNLKNAESLLPAMRRAVGTRALRQAT